ncbi:eukaryotic translation initiation factor 3, subunit 6, putative [Plasmodium ovale wallikeri]|uniref:Eukaryotic translation initiation factor 3 subunit E n=1 Tax=Plasmodium ovale wallikeri TaxID=864142 RepID=A0A1A8YWK8_PLAOA|nr:eukaryotic translation initiation factor 3, subunit 6, putative [Plasmodium ovale wallikeri]
MDESDNSTTSSNAQSNLIGKVCSYLDPHMTQIIFAWLKENKVHRKEQKREQKKERKKKKKKKNGKIVSRVGILDDAEIEKNLSIMNDGCERELIGIENEFTNGNRGVISNCLDSLEIEIEEFQQAMNDYKNDQVNKIGGSVEKKSIMALREWCNAYSSEKNITYTFSDNIDDKILKLSRYYYQKKDYEKSKKNLLLYILNISEIVINISDSPKMRTCYWGIISNIINSYFQNINNDDYIFCKNDEHKIIIKDEIINEINVCVETIVKLSQLLSKDKVTKNEIILQRSWLIHWSLILIFHFFIKDHFELILNTVNMVKSKYTDSFTSLLISIFTDYDFNMAQKCIAEIGFLSSQDVFLYKLKPYIEEQSRFIIFETYCRIHKSINIDMIANKVNLPRDEAEKWIVNLIRNAKLDAKIDSEKNCIEISTTLPNLYQQVIDKTQNLTMRSNFLVQVLNRSSTDEHFQKNVRFKNKNEKGKNTKRNKPYNAMYGAGKPGNRLVSANM